MKASWHIVGLKSDTEVNAKAKLSELGFEIRETDEDGNLLKPEQVVGRCCSRFVHDYDGYVVFAVLLTDEQYALLPEMVPDPPELVQVWDDSWTEDAEQTRTDPATGETITEAVTQPVPVPSIHLPDMTDSDTGEMIADRYEDLPQFQV